MNRSKLLYSVDSISNPQASKSASGIYLEFLFLRAHSRKRVDRMYWSGLSLNSFTICSKEVTVGTTGPMGSGLPQFGFPRRFAIDFVSLRGMIYACILGNGLGELLSHLRKPQLLILRIFSSKINKKMHGFCIKMRTPNFLWKTLYTLVIQRITLSGSFPSYSNAATFVRSKLVTIESAVARY